MTAAAVVRSGWCRKHAAVTAKGAPTTARSPDAARWCAIGAILRAYDGDEQVKAQQRLEARVGRGKQAAKWNDESDQETVAVTLEELGL